MGQEKEKVKVQEKLERYTKESLLQFLDLLDVHVSRTLKKVQCAVWMKLRASWLLEAFYVVSGIEILGQNLDVWVICNFCDQLHVREGFKQETLGISRLEAIVGRSV